jgi:hypothetical protein
MLEILESLRLNGRAKDSAGKARPNEIASGACEHRRPTLVRAAETFQRQSAAELNQSGRQAEADAVCNNLDSGFGPPGFERHEIWIQVRARMRRLIDQDVRVERLCRLRVLFL